MRQSYLSLYILLVISPNILAAPPNPTASDAVGNTAGGTDTLLNVHTGGYNTGFGYYSLASNAAGNGNTAAGAYALQFNTGSLNTATGYYSLNSNTNGFQNTASGYNSLGNNTTGNGNTALGTFSLLQNGAGSYNTASGYESLLGNTSGTQNTATGYRSLYSNTIGVNNTGIGTNSLKSNTTGNGNAAIGINALYNNTTGGQNLAFGRWALISNTIGSSNIGLGNNAGSNLTTGSNNIDIGSSGEAGEEATIRIGDGAVQTRTFIAGIRGVQNLASSLPVYIDPNGQLGIAVSSEQYKEDIKDMSEASHKVLELRPVTYRYRTPDTAGNKPLEYGLIAEEVAKVYPDLVAYDAEGHIQSVQYQKLTPMLLNEVQRLAEENKELARAVATERDRNLQQSRELQRMSQQVARMDTQNQRMEALEVRLRHLETESSNQQVVMMH